MPPHQRQSFSIPHIFIIGFPSGSSSSNSPLRSLARSLAARSSAAANPPHRLRGAVFLSHR
jgi:hypothetical protein